MTSFSIMVGANLSLVDDFVTTPEGDTGTTEVTLCIVLNSNLVLDRDVVLLLNTDPLNSEGKKAHFHFVT